MNRHLDNINRLIEDIGNKLKLAELEADKYQHEFDQNNENEIENNDNEFKEYKNVEIKKFDLLPELDTGDHRLYLSFQTRNNKMDGDFELLALEHENSRYNNNNNILKTKSTNHLIITGYFNNGYLDGIVNIQNLGRLYSINYCGCVYFKNFEKIIEKVLNATRRLEKSYYFDNGKLLQMEDTQFIGKKIIKEYSSKLNRISSSNSQLNGKIYSHKLAKKLTYVNNILTEEYYPLHYDKKYRYYYEDKEHDGMFSGWQHNIIKKILYTNNNKIIIIYDKNEKEIRRIYENEFTNIEGFDGIEIV